MLCYDAYLHEGAEMRTFPRQKLYDLSHRRFFRAWLGGRLNDARDGNFISEFQRFIETGRDVIPLSRGRLGIYFAIKSAVRQGRRRVLLSPFTIFDLVNMVICAGGDPVFVDTEPDSPHISLQAIRNSWDDRVAAVIVTHYHSTHPQLIEIARVLKSAGVVLVEDCAISLGGRSSGISVGLHGDFGIFSFGLFKFVATYYGGALVVRDSKIASAIRNEMSIWRQMRASDLRPYLLKGLKFDALTESHIFSLLTFPVFRWGYVNDVPYIKKQAVNDPEPIFRDTLPEEYKRRPSDFQQREWTRQLSQVLENRKRRLANARAYLEELGSSGAIVCPPAPDESADCFINFPVLVSDRDRVLTELMKRGYDASPNHYRNCAELPIFARYGQELPNLRSFVSRLLALPCYPGMPQHYLRSLARALREEIVGKPAMPQFRHLAPVERQSS